MKNLFTDTPSIVLAIVASTLLAPLPAATDNVLLESLQGCWQGKAVKTPRGPLSYPICFELQEDNTLYGVADLDVSRHHWRFNLSESKRQLSFLSTFAGNKTPINLSASQVASDHIIFTADNSNYLQVRVQQQGKEYRFTIQVKGKEHVIIRLSPKEK